MGWGSCEPREPANEGIGVKPSPNAGSPYPFSVDWAVHESNLLRRAELIGILSDYNHWSNFDIKKQLYEREELSSLARNLNVKVVNIIKGARNVGKSSLVLTLLKKEGLQRESLIIDPEDPRLPLNIDAKFLYECLQAYLTYVSTSPPKIIVIDEAQHIEGWERFARYVVETEKIKCIVTGSCSELSSDEFATVLTGRHLDVVVFPLSFFEFLKFKGIEIKTPLEMELKRLLIKHMFEEYLKFGGFPEVVLAKDETTKTNLLITYFFDILTRDVVNKHNLRLPLKIESIAKYCLSNIGSIVSMRKIANSYEVALRSVERFFKFFSDAYLFFLVKKFSTSKRQQERSLAKVYAIDTGFYSALGFKISERKDKLMENCVAIELIRRYGNENVFYWRDYNEHEIDFVVKKEKLQLIQVTYASSKNEIKENEYKNLIEASKQLKSKNLLCITWDYEAEEKYNGRKIIFKPLWKWLLEEKVKGP
jgi:predicted AAA+ superfamily ATPase